MSDEKIDNSDPISNGESGDLKTVDDSLNDQETMTVQTLSGVFWLSAGSVVQSGLRLLITMIFARLLLPAEFGLVAAALTVIGFIEIFSLIGIGPSVIQFPHLAERHIRVSFTLSLIFGLVAGGLVVVAAELIATFYEMPNLVPVLQLLAINFPLLGATVVAESLLRRELQFRKLTIANITSYAFGYGAVGIIMALNGFGVWALVIATISQSVLFTIILFIMQPHSLGLHWDKVAAKEMIHLGGGFTASKIFNYIARQGDYLIVGRWLGADALGLYSRAYSLMNTSIRLSSKITDKVLFTAMAKVQKDPKRIRRAYRRSLSLVALFAMPLSVVMLILAPELILVLLGPNWEGVIAPFQFLAVGMYFRTGYKVSGAVIRAKGAVYRSASLKVIYAIMIIGGALIAQQWGITAVALTTTLALIGHFIMFSRLAIRLAEVSWLDFFKAHLAGGRLALILGLITFGIATPLRSANVSTTLIFLATLSTLAIVLLIMLRFASRFTLGKEGLWLLQSVLDFSAKRVPKLNPLLKSIHANFVQA